MAGAGAKPFVNAKIEQRVVVLFAKRSVPECGWVEKLLGDYRLPPDIYEVAHIESRQDVTQIDNYFQTLCLTDTRAVPHLFIGGKYIGGEKKIRVLHESGDLRRILVAAGATK